MGQGQHSNKGEKMTAIEFVREAIARGHTDDFIIQCLHANGIYLETEREDVEAERKHTQKVKTLSISNKQEGEIDFNKWLSAMI